MAFNISDFRGQLEFGGARPSLFEVQIFNPANTSGDLKTPFLVRAAQLPGRSRRPLHGPDDRLPDVGLRVAEPIGRARRMGRDHRRTGRERRGAVPAVVVPIPARPGYSASRGTETGVYLDGAMIGEATRGTPQPLYDGRLMTLSAQQALRAANIAILEHGVLAAAVDDAGAAAIHQELVAYWGAQ